VLFLTRQPPWPVLKDISWEILPLVAGLFVLVEALNHSGVQRAIVNLVEAATNRSATMATLGTGVTMAVVSNLVNNLPAGLLAGSAVHASHAPDHIASAVLIGVDLGPNLSVMGSLATILWLAALRRENQHVSAWSFLKVGRVW